jgi:hypothetical protein
MNAASLTPWFIVPRGPESPKPRMNVGSSYHRLIHRQRAKRRFRVRASRPGLEDAIVRRRVRCDCAVTRDRIVPPFAAFVLPAPPSSSLPRGPNAPRCVPQILHQYEYILPSVPGIAVFVNRGCTPPLPPRVRCYFGENSDHALIIVFNDTTSGCTHMTGWGRGGGCPSIYFSCP